MQSIYNSINKYKSLYNHRWKYFKTLVDAMLWADRIEKKTGKRIAIMKVYQKVK